MLIPAEEQRGERERLPGKLIKERRKAAKETFPTKPIHVCSRSTQRCERLGSCETIVAELRGLMPRMSLTLL